MEMIIRRLPINRWQKLYNQWRHDYHLEILKIVHHEILDESRNILSDECTIYLTRKPKNNN